MVATAASPDAATVLPLGRWDVESYSRLFSGPSVRFGSVLKGVEFFDNTAFGLSSAEAVLQDPQQRLLLECVLELGGGGGLEAANPVMTVIGLSSIDYAGITARWAPGATAFTATASSPSVASG